jgi:hypothetical protein
MGIMDAQIKTLEMERDYHRNQSLVLQEHNSALTLQIQEFVLASPSVFSLGQPDHLQELQQRHQEELAALTLKFYTEEQKFAEQVAGLTKLNEEQMVEMQRVHAIENQHQELRGLRKRRMASEDTVLHLWQVKEMEYQNLNAILEAIRGPRRELVGARGLSSAILEHNRSGSMLGLNSNFGEPSFCATYHQSTV